MLWVLIRVATARPAISMTVARSFLYSGVKPGVADDKQPNRSAWAIDASALGQFSYVHPRTPKKNLRRRAAVDMHFFIVLAAGLNLDVLRFEGAGDRRRCQHDRAEKIWSLGVATGGDRAHVPDDRPLRFHVDGRHEQPPSLGVLGRDQLHRVVVDPLAVSTLQRIGVGQAVTVQDGKEPAETQDVVAGDRCVRIAEGGIILGAEEGHGGDQRSAADPRDEFELWPIAGRRPPIQKARTERAMIAPTRQRQDIRGFWRFLVGMGGVVRHLLVK